MFGVRYSGLAHADAGRTMLVSLVVWLFASLLVAGLLSVTAERVFRGDTNRDEAADVAPRIAPTAAMAIARASHSLRVLPDGTGLPRLS